MSYSNNPSAPPSPTGHPGPPNLTSENIDQNNYFLNQAQAAALQQDFEQFTMVSKRSPSLSWSIVVFVFSHRFVFSSFHNDPTRCLRFKSFRQFHVVLVRKYLWKRLDESSRSFDFTGFGASLKGSSNISLITKSGAIDITLRFGREQRLHRCCFIARNAEAKSIALRLRHFI